VREVITAPAFIRRRTPVAAAGARPPRRPRAARLAIRVAAAGTLAGILAACGASGSAAKPGNVFRTRQQVSLQQVDRAIAALYRAHPGISSFAAQDVQYTAESRNLVLRECTSGVSGAAGATAADSATAESSQVMACAPLIFFLYRYGQTASVPDSVAAAGQLYWYAVTHIAGQASVRTSLNELLNSWRLPVPGLTAAQAKKAVEASVVTAADDSILARTSVHLVITSHKAGSAAVAERIVADIGAATGIESITAGPATATIRVTRTDAYLTGSPAGLTTFIGLPAAAARKAGSRWVDIKAGTQEYSDLAAEDTISSLPASILPATGNAVQLRTSTQSGQKVYVLDWKATASGSGTKVGEQLILAASAQALPISETTTANGDSQTVTLGRWGKRFNVPVPSSTVPYSRVKS
jgi:hypothetical protein